MFLATALLCALWVGFGASTAANRCQRPRR